MVYEEKCKSINSAQPGDRQQVSGIWNVPANRIGKHPHRTTSHRSVGQLLALTEVCLCVASRVASRSAP